MKKLHSIYVLTGKAFCKLMLDYWKLRDKVSPPKSDSVLFVAHPDDDTLFFHTFIKERKPYVCLMTTGWSMRRIPDFFKVMRRYGVRYRAYPLGAKDDRMDLLEKQVETVLNIADFKTVATHNSTGEYGHEEHIRVHEAVMDVIEKRKQVYTVLCPVERSKIENYQLPQEITAEKLFIFKNLYVTESWVPYDEPAGTPVWVTHEKLERQQT